jgi:anti-sigma factor RsiW
VSCPENETLIHGYLDGKLDLVNALRLEAHLKECPTCAQAYKNHKALSGTLKSGPFYFKASGNLERRIRTALVESDPVASQPTASAQTAKWRTLPRLSWAFLSVAASLALVALIAPHFVPWPQHPSPAQLLAEEVLASHVRSLMASHLTDVPSSDQHTVKPWFDGKLDFSPPVEDLSAQGFPLVGGRLDYLAGRPVAAVVYQRRKHIINLFIWPSTEGSAQKAVMRQGYNMVHWTRAGMTYWAASDLNYRELGEFVRLVQDRVPPKLSP